MLHAVRQTAVAKGLFVFAQWLGTGRETWQFFDGRSGRIVMEYRPATGRWTGTGGGHGECDGPWAALAAAANLVGATAAG